MDDFRKDRLSDGSTLKRHLKFILKYWTRRPLGYLLSSSIEGNSVKVPSAAKLLIFSWSHHRRRRFHWSSREANTFDHSCRRLVLQPQTPPGGASASREIIILFDVGDDILGPHLSSSPLANSEFHSYFIFTAVALLIFPLTPPPTATHLPQAMHIPGSAS